MHYLLLWHVVSHFQAHSNQNSELGTRRFQLRKWPLVVLVCVVSTSYLIQKQLSAQEKMFGPAVIGFSSRGCFITGSNGKIALRQGALQKAFHSASKRTAKAHSAPSSERSHFQTIFEDMANQFLLNMRICPLATPLNSRSTVALTCPWPWRPITPSSKLPAHTILEERVIYARPLSFSPRKHLFLGFTLAGCGVMFWMMPDKPRMADWFSEDVGLFK